MRRAGGGYTQALHQASRPARMMRLTGHHAFQSSHLGGTPTSPTADHQPLQRRWPPPLQARRRPERRPTTTTTITSIATGRQPPPSVPMPPPPPLRQQQQPLPLQVPAPGRLLPPPPPQGPPTARPGQACHPGPPGTQVGPHPTSSQFPAPKLVCSRFPVPTHTPLLSAQGEPAGGVFSEMALALCMLPAHARSPSITPRGHDPTCMCPLSADILCSNASQQVPARSRRPSPSPPPAACPPTRPPLRPPLAVPSRQARPWLALWGPWLA